MNKLTIGIIILVVAVGGFAFINSGNKIENKNNQKATNEIAKFGEGINAVIYKEPECGCCEGYIKGMKEKGFNVKVVATDNLDAIKNKYGIPADEQSCHTVAVDNYFVEGHVPMKAVRKLLKEKPEIKGIGLPGMPAGALGMPGLKSAPYEVYQKNEDDSFSNYMTI